MFKTGMYQISLLSNLQISSKIIIKAFFLLVLLLLWHTIALSQHEHMHDEHPIPAGQFIGDISFDVSCNDAVQEDFNHAMGMLHHMMYETSRAFFNDIIETDPTCAMAYWGVATSLFQPLWATRPSEDDLNRGYELITKALELAVSEREVLLIQSTEAFFREPESVDFHTRMHRWAEAMEVAYQNYPDDNDVAALYSLTRLSNAQFTDNRAPLYDEAEQILREIFENNPTHPGAIHYMIHATDVDGRAENAIDMVEAYGEIAPNVPHALHMPSHIYVRLGDWPEVINWNIRSAEAALNYPVNGAESHHYIHAIDYLVYGYLQRGEDELAMMAYDEVLTKERHQPTFISAFHSAVIPARLAIEQQDWESAYALEARLPDYLPWDDSPWAEGLTWYAKGLAAVNLDDIELAMEAEQELERLRKYSMERGDAGIATYINIDKHVLSGFIAHAQGEDDQAIESMKTAIELENTIEKHPVTPGALLPPNEALGNLLTDLNRYEEAIEAYEASDATWPQRYHTLLGAARAARLSGNHEAAHDYYERLLAGIGDTNREAIQEAEGFMAGLE